MTKLKRIPFEFEKHTIVNWICLDCKTYHKSDSREHHKMDNCKCGNGVDHETYITRLLGNVKINSTKKISKGGKDESKL